MDIMEEERLEQLRAARPYSRFLIRGADVDGVAEGLKQTAHLRPEDIRDVRGMDEEQPSESTLVLLYGRDPEYAKTLSETFRGHGPVVGFSGPGAKKKYYRIYEDGDFIPADRYAARVNVGEWNGQMAADIEIREHLEDTEELRFRFTLEGLSMSDAVRTMRSLQESCGRHVVERIAVPTKAGYFVAEPEHVRWYDGLRIALVDDPSKKDISGDTIALVEYDQMGEKTVTTTYDLCGEYPTGTITHQLDQPQEERTEEDYGK